MIHKTCHPLFLDKYSACHIANSCKVDAVGHVGHVGHADRVPNDVQVAMIDVMFVLLLADR